MRFGINLGHFTGSIPADLGSRVRRAEELGFESLWCAEAYGSDVFTPLAYCAAHTESMRLGTAVAQIPGRTPAATAMAAGTLDHLSRGRAVLGIGASGPQVSEGWHGVPFPRPLARTREYVGVVRQVLQRNRPVANDGEFYPLPSPTGTGLGKSLRSALHPYRPDLPVYLGAEGPRNIALCGEIADGWLAMFFSPANDALFWKALDEGFEVRGGRPERFEVVATVPVVVHDDIEAAADQVRPMIALYAGGMGATGANFHFDLLSRIGFGAEATAIQQRYVEGDRKGAIAAVTTDLVDELALIGTSARIRDRLSIWEGTIVDSIALDGLPEDVHSVAKALGLA